MSSTYPGYNEKIKSLTDADCPIRNGRSMIKGESFDLFDLLADGQASVSDLENLERDINRHNISECIALILSGECSLYRAQEVILPDDLTEDVDPDDYSGTGNLALIEDPELVDAIKADLPAGPRAYIEELGAKALDDDVLLGRF